MISNQLEEHRFPPYEDGYLAAYNNKTNSENPRFCLYPHKSKEREIWFTGYKDYQEDVDVRTELIYGVRKLKFDIPNTAK